MPWTRKQVKYLFSSGSPLSGEQKEKMHAELHANPSMGHKKKGSSALQKAPTKKAASKPRQQASGLNWRDHWGKNKVKKGE